MMSVSQHVLGKPTSVSRDQVAAACAVHSLHGWRGYVTSDPRRTGRYIAVIHSSDYDPVRQKGLMVARHGRDPADALAIAIEAAGGRDPELTS
jgi:hypothetical protein